MRKDNTTTKFLIIDSVKFEESLKLGEKQFIIHASAIKAVEDMSNRIALRKGKNPGSVQIDAAYNKSTIRKAIKEEVITQSVLHSLICLFFNELKDDKYTRSYTKESIENFLSSIELHHNELGSITRFRAFFSLLEIPKKFHPLEITIDENWNFTVSNTEDSPIILLENDSLKKGENLVKEQLQARTKKTSLLQSALKSIGSLNIKKAFWIVFSILIIAGGYLGVQWFQEKREVERISNIINLAKETSRTRNVELDNLFSEINKELKEDYNNDKKRSLSTAIISRIIAMSDRFKPYLYLRKGKVIDRPLSRERAELFKNLIDLNLDRETTRQIFNKTNFSHSDFYEKDLSNINLMKGLPAFSGMYGNDAFLVITSIKRLNFKNSDFTRANLNKSRLYGDFSNSDFSRAIIYDTYFAGSKLSGASFEENEIVVQFAGCEVDNASFKNSTLYCNFSDCDLRGTIFDDSNIYTLKRYDDRNRIINPLENLNDFYSPYADYTFANVFLAPDDLFFEFKFNMLTISNYVQINSHLNKDNPFKFAADVTFTRHHKNKNERIREAKYPIVLAIFEDKHKLLVDDDFNEPWKDEISEDFIKVWKENSDDIFSYIVRTNDHYFDSKEIYQHSYNRYHGIQEPEMVYDTVQILASKDTHFTKMRKEYSSDHKYHKFCEPLKFKSNKKAASFKNCTFHNISFKTKISNVSFQGSNFIDVTFKSSHLFNLNMKNTKGNILIDSNSTFDSILVGNKHFLTTLNKFKDSIAKKKFRLRGKPFTISDHLDSIEKSKNLDYKLSYRLGYDMEILYRKYLNLDLIQKRMIVNKESNNTVYLRDKTYLKTLDSLSKLKRLDQKRLDQ